MHNGPVNIALDVGYDGNTAFCAGVLFARWDDPEPADIVTVELANAAAYKPGYFYLRELPSLVAALARVTCDLGCVVIDGYVTLDADSRPGLGFKLWEHLDRAIPVIGVAKTRFAGTPDKSALIRGASRRPLYVTTAGIDLVDAKARIAAMHGQHRIPTLLKLADGIARGRVSPEDA